MVQFLIFDPSLRLYAYGPLCVAVTNTRYYVVLSDNRVVMTGL